MPRDQAEAEYDPLHECMIRNRRDMAPGHWSNSDIDCLLRRLDEARAEARRQAIEECARIIEDWGQHPAAALAASLRALLLSASEDGA